MTITHRQKELLERYPQLAQKGTPEYGDATSLAWIAQRRGIPLNSDRFLDLLEDHFAKMPTENTIELTADQKEIAKNSRMTEDEYRELEILRRQRVARGEIQG